MLSKPDLRQGEFAEFSFGRAKVPFIDPDDPATDCGQVDAANIQMDNIKKQRQSRVNVGSGLQIMKQGLGEVRSNLDLALDLRAPRVRDQVDELAAQLYRTATKINELID